jgi:hypothetical protein
MAGSRDRARLRGEITGGVIARPEQATGSTAI